MRYFCQSVVALVLLAGCQHTAAPGSGVGYGASGSKETVQTSTEGASEKEIGVTADATSEPYRSEIASVPIDGGASGGIAVKRTIASASPIDPKTEPELAEEADKSCFNYRIRHGKDLRQSLDSRSPPELIMSDGGISNLTFRLESGLGYAFEDDWPSPLMNAHVRLVYYPDGREGTKALFIDSWSDPELLEGANLSFKDAKLNYGLIVFYIMLEKDCAFASPPDYPKGLVRLTDAERDAFVDHNAWRVLGEMRVIPTPTMINRLRVDPTKFTRSVKP